MPISPGDLKAIEKAPTAVGSVIAVMEWLHANHTIDVNVKGIVIHALEASASVLEPAIKANTAN
jgi:hypothetical protein